VLEPLALRSLFHLHVGRFFLYFLLMKPPISWPKSAASLTFIMVVVLQVEFKLDAAFWNAGPNYLSACEEALPTLFAAFSAAFFVAGAAWISTLMNAKPTVVHHIHWLMAVLVFFKVLLMCLSFE